MLLRVLPWLTTALVISGTAGEENENNTFAIQERPYDITNAAVCPSPYELIGNQCLFVDNRLYGTWEEIRAFCQALNGDLVSLEDANSLGHIFLYLTSSGLNDVSYWTGANDKDVEGTWVWIKNGANVRMNIPLWGDDDSQVLQPAGGFGESCGFLNMNDHYFLDDTDCFLQHSTICEADVQVTVTTQGSSNSSKVDIECRHPFDQVGNACLLVNDVPASHTDQLMLCYALEGHPVKLKDANLLGDIYDFLKSNGFNTSLWIGAAETSQPGLWRWSHDDELVQFGAPYWGDIEIGIQRPDEDTNSGCGCLYYPDHFYFIDLNCDAELGIICEANN